jgi:signal transduction histidine kinase
MRPFSTSLMAVVLCGTLSVAANPLGEQSQLPLEQRLAEIDAQLAKLANYSLNGGIGAIGYRSKSNPDENKPEWVEIRFDHEVPLDEVVLVPAIRRDTANGFQADAFPKSFRLIAGSHEDPEGRVVADHDCPGDARSSIAPFIIPCNGIRAAWIRIEATRLSLRAFDGRYIFQLSEILAFSGSENVALRQAVKTSSNVVAPSGAWDRRFVVDGVLPYLMDAAEGEQSVAYQVSVTDEDPPAITLDLGTSQPVSHIHLHATEQSDTMPQAFAGDVGIPRHLRIEGANRPDFSDSSLLLDLHHDTIYDIGPILMRDLPGTPCRYIRLLAIKSRGTSFYGRSLPSFGFAEIEVFSNGRNIALHATARTNLKTANLNRPISHLTDGRNLYGDILTIRDWLHQLTLRHELETERPLVADELNRRYARQKTNLNRMSWLAALLTAGIGFTILIDRNIHMKQQTRLKERFAADLHDELGANLHTIGLLGDLARESVDSREELIELLERTRVFTERSGAAARYCTNMLEAKGLCEDLVEEMKRSSARLLADLEYDLSFKGEENLKHLRPRRIIDVFLFYKESLTNILRHSGASRVETTLSADRKQLELTIADNGHGLSGEVPPSLKRRARLLGAQVSVENPASGGTRISLHLRMRKLGVFR